MEQSVFEAYANLLNFSKVKNKNHNQHISG